MESTLGPEDTITVIRKFLHVGNVNDALNNLKLLMESEDLNPRQKLLSDILNIRILLELGQFGESSFLIESLISEYDKENFRIEGIELNTLLATSYFTTARIDESIKLIDITFELIEKLHETERRACEEFATELLNLRGLIYSTQGNWDLAINDFKQSLVTWKKFNYRKEIGMGYYNISHAYRYQNMITQSISSVEDAINTFKEIDYIDGLVTSYNTIKEIYQHSGNDDQAFYYKQKTDELSEKIKFRNYVKETTISQNNQSREIEKLNQELIEHKQEIWSIKLELNSAADSLSDGETFSAQLVDGTKQEKEKLKNELEEYKNRNIEVSDRITSLSTEFSDIKIRYDNLTKENEGLKLEYDDQIKENISLNNKIDEFDDNLSKLKEDYRLEVENIKSEVTRKHDSDESDLLLKQEIEQLKSSLQEKENMIININSKLEEKAVENQELLTKLEENKAVPDSPREEKQQISTEDVKLPIETYSEISAQPVVEEKIETEIKPHVVSKITPTLQKRIRASGPDRRLQDILESSKLAENIAKILDRNKKLKLKFLAMQIGTSPGAVMVEIKKLANVNFVQINYENTSDSNPMIVLK